ncbi:virulence-associated E family protein [Clostridium sp.]|uniref:virulence-associated E family protein n=1 Tax=Clostridium sp. TaxID=1506 RepID=UPI003216A968
MKEKNIQGSLKYEGSLTLAVGKSRRDKQWNNVHVTWGQLIEKLSSTVYTSETFEEYRNAPKDLQDNIKDVGGFVGGTLKDGRRTKASVTDRQLLTLDCDYATSYLWDTLDMLFDFAVVIYSTHKHCNEKPRFRLVIPLNRKVTPEEYEAIGRKVARDIGMDYFDDSTYESSRLMYWPSTSSDGDFVFHYKDAPWLDADEVLNTYENWKDRSSWPESSRVKKDRRALANRQGSPREKAGIIGAFCRSYSTTQVIEKFLNHIYIPTMDKDRYTYTNGSTSGGLVIYQQGDFAYSYHSTDPMSGLLCNAFDLMRIHSFGHLDEGVPENTPSINLPSYKAMIDFARNDNEVKLTIGKERLLQAKMDFKVEEDIYDHMDEGHYNKKEDIYNNEETKYSYNNKAEETPYNKEEVNSYNNKEAIAMDKKVQRNDLKENDEVKVFVDNQMPNKDIVDLPENNKEVVNKNIGEIALSEEHCHWMQHLEVDKLGQYKSTIENISLILENDENLKGKIALNEFSHRTVIKGNLPWHRLLNKKEGDQWKDSDDSALRHYIEKVYRITSPMKINDGLLIVEEKNKFHPIRDYFNSLVWDGVKRVDNLFIDYLGASDNNYTRMVTRKALVAGVARIFNPGVKFDYMLVLVGKQGVGKSHILSLLGQNWYSDSFNTVQGKEAYEQLQDAWIIEMAELTAAKKAETEAVKHFISKREDIYRVAYGKRVTKFPRQCIFFGTTNEMDFLKDKTGNRRFWPVMVDKNRVKKDLWREDIKTEIHQIWSEAFHLWKKGEGLFLELELEKQAVKIQEQHTERSFMEGLIHEYLEMPIPENWADLDVAARRSYIHGDTFKEEVIPTKKRDKVCAMEIWVELLQGEPKYMKPMNSREINDVLRILEDWEPYNMGTGKLRFGKNYGIQRAFIRKATDESS